MTNFEVSILFLLQLAVILGACRVVGQLARRLGQPQVVGEMIAGVALGPSLLGLVAPGLHLQLFPPKSASMTVVYCVAQVGLVLYMFLVGVEFRADLLRSRARSAVSVSIAGMGAPFILGGALALGFFHNADLFNDSISRPQAVLYLGAAMSITAFPMLARIIYERGLSGTSLGTLALAAGSIDDAAAWCVLAVVLASAGGSATMAVLAIGGGIAYALLVLVPGRRLMGMLGAAVERRGSMSPDMFAFVLMLLVLAGWFTDRIGIYAVFGAFILGAGMPRGLFAKELQRMIEPLTVNLLLPMFFVYSGLNTRITLLNSWELWGLAALVLAVACVGKGVACAAAARLNGEPAREALAIGALMNSRGLMELIILNIGLEKGIITPTLFSIMIIMAVVTTLMATPLFEWAYGRSGERAAGWRPGRGAGEGGRGRGGRFDGVAGAGE